MNNIKDVLFYSIKYRLAYEGINIEINKDFNNRSFNIKEEVENNNINVNIKSEYINMYLLLYTFARMIKENKIDININNNITAAEMFFMEGLIEDIKIKMQKESEI